MMRRALLTVVVGGGLAWSGPAQTADLEREGPYWVEAVSGVVTAAEAARLRVVSRGNVVVNGDGGPNVFYALKKRVQARNATEARRLLSACAVRPQRFGEVLTLALDAPARQAVMLDLEVRCPRAVKHAWIETQSGRISVRDLAGEVHAFTAGGAVDADRVGGPLNVRTGGGEIRLGTIQGVLHAVTGGGPVFLARAGSEAWIESGGGELMIEEAGGPLHLGTGAGNIEVRRAAGSVSARTFGGLIKVIEAGGEVNAETAGGGIQVGAARGVKCESAAGGIKLRGVSGELRVSTAVGSILAELLAGRPIGDSLLSTNSGDITVWIPSNLAVTVQAQNGSPGRLGRIISDFPEIRVRAENRRDKDATVATGALNGGGPLLQIAAAEGTIYLRRQR